MILREETTVQGLEGRIVAAVLCRWNKKLELVETRNLFKGRNEISVGVEEDPKINAVTEVDEKIQEESRDIRIVMGSSKDCEYGWSGG